VQLVLVVLAVVFIAGFFLDWFEIVLIILPLLAPVIKLAGVDMTWFLILIALMLQTSFLTPPVGFSLFYLKGVVPKGVTIKDIYVGVIPFVLLQLADGGAVLHGPRHHHLAASSRCTAAAADVP
jgi:TRAP-type mannitol/chloroaromatic compound transport system permease large subunit